MSVKKSIAIYDRDQLSAYQEAVEELANEGKIDDEAAEGEKLATLAREYTSDYETSSEHNAGTASALWDMLSIGLGIIGVLIFLFGAFAAVMAVFAWVFGLHLPGLFPI